MNENIFQRFASKASHPDKPFLTTTDGNIVTYGELFGEAARFANLLTALGVQPGDRVAVQTEKTPHSLYLYLGCLAAGGVYLPLNTAYTPAEISYFLGDAEPRVFVCDPRKREDLAKVASSAGVARLETLGAEGAGSVLEKAAGRSDGFEAASRDADDLAAILYTSGTTGRSKGAMLSHGNLYSNAAALVDYWRISADDVLLHALPIYHTHGLFVAIGTTLMTGGSMIYLPRFDLDEVMRHLPDATTMMGVPTFYSRLLSRPDFDRDFTRHMRLFVSGSAPLSAEVHKEFSARTGHAILERYGMTETNMNTSNPYDGDRRAGTVGFPLPGVELRITNGKTPESLEQGAVGMIEIRGPNVFKGYWRNPEKTAEELRPDGYFITGDMGVIDERGYVSIVGRNKDLVITGGFNVYPAEVEAELDAIPGVSESAVIGVPHRDFGEGVTAVLAPREGAALDETEIRRRLETKLAKFKVPKRVIVVDALPRNTMGKIQKNVLRDTYKDLYAE